MGLGDGIGMGLDWTGLVLGSLIGLWMAIRVEMTGMPELVALFNGFGGAASALVALSEIWRFIEGSSDSSAIEQLELTVIMIAAGLSALVGWMTLDRIHSRHVQTQGRRECFREWIKTPTWGPVWLNPLKGPDGYWSRCLNLLTSMLQQTKTISGVLLEFLRFLVLFWSYQ